MANEVCIQITTLQSISISHFSCQNFDPLLTKNHANDAQKPNSAMRIAGAPSPFMV